MGLFKAGGIDGIAENPRRVYPLPATGSIAITSA